jgi:1,4-alpha-glucan branching enzyme
VGALTRTYRVEPALHQIDFSSEGFEWIDAGNAEMSVTSFIRKGAANTPPVLVVTNFTPVPRQNFLLGVPHRGLWREILNSDGREYGGSGWGNLGSIESAPVSSHGRVNSVNVNVPPLATVMFRWEGHG